MQTFLLTDWTTIRGVVPNVTQITQEESQWLDLTPFGSAFFWLDCRGITNGPQIYIDTAPCRDEAFFTPMVGPITLAASQTPVLLFAGTPGASILARFVRWRLTQGANGPWD